MTTPDQIAAEFQAKMYDQDVAEQARTVLLATEIALSHLPAVHNAALATKLETILEEISIARAGL